MGNIQRFKSNGIVFDEKPDKSKTWEFKTPIGCEVDIINHDGTVVELHPVESPPVNVPAPKHKGE